MFEELNKHRQLVAENIEKALQIGFTDSEELEKAHNVGDVHPNGKWVWTQLPSGKYDWRVIKKTSAGSSAAASSTTQKPALGALKGVNAMKEYLTTFNSRYTDMSKVEVMRTPKGNWDVHYDGHRLGIFAGNQVPEGTAKKMGWLRTDSKDLTRSKRNAEEEVKKKEFHIGSKITVDNAQDFANRINNGELHVVNTRGKNQLYVVVKASEPYYYNGKNKVQLTFKYIGSDKNNLLYPDGTDYDDFTIDELNTMVSNSSLSIARKNNSKKRKREE